MKTMLFILFTLSSLLSLNALADGDIQAGKAKAAVCFACHGQNGKALMPTYPNLAGQNKAYLVSSLKAYRSKERRGGLSSLMYSQAGSLSDDDINNLAAYFSSLTPQ
ncbi:MAG TPA: cytochrome c [Methylophaga aminisulfidivorans]|uniref:Cytochrome c n=2 Tax=root TaxID=1 RepID=A0A7C2AML6_9GAMM|nr:cytochrome c [Methylophaga aminisulfidivorans]HEC72934.1 cytochrome c [Methylophaga aminisulfidivorans]